MQVPQMQVQTQDAGTVDVNFRRNEKGEKGRGEG